MSKTRESVRKRARSVVVEEASRATDRRGSRRLSLDLVSTVPVLVLEGGNERLGLARNISDGGMLIEMTSLPPIGRIVEVCFPRPDGTIDPTATFVAEVRHQVLWSLSAPASAKQFAAIGVRFLATSIAPTGVKN